MSGNSWLLSSVLKLNWWRRGKYESLKVTECVGILEEMRTNGITEFVTVLVYYLAFRTRIPEHSWNHERMMSSVELIMCLFFHEFLKVFDDIGGCITRMRGAVGSKAVLEGDDKMGHHDDSGVSSGGFCADDCFCHANLPDGSRVEILLLEMSLSFCRFPLVLVQNKATTSRQITYETCAHAECTRKALSATHSQQELDKNISPLWTDYHYQLIKSRSLTHSREDAHLIFISSTRTTSSSHVRTCALVCVCVSVVERNHNRHLMWSEKLQSPISYHFRYVLNQRSAEISCRPQWKSLL